MELENLHICDNQRITKYLVKFIDWLLGSNGDTLHFDVSSIMGFHPRLRTKSLDLENTTIFRNYEPCHRPLMPDTGNANLKPLERLQQTEP